MNKGLRRYSLLVTCATFCLIIAGALVTSNDAGLATSDWPRSNGQWFPRMVGNLFWEHGHRIVATTVGFLTIGLVVFLYFGQLERRLHVERRARRWLVSFKPTISLDVPYRGEPRRWVRRLGWVALAGVVAQGLLGALTVKLMLPLVVSAAHATLAQLFFCTVVSLSVFTSRSWHDKWAEQGSASGTRLSYLSIAAVITIFLQLILGATLRHSATWDHELPIQLVLAHIGGALTVAIVLGRATLTVLRRHSFERYLTTPAKLALLLLGVQLALGVTAYLTRRASTHQPQPLNPMIGVTVAHVACGALVFATTIVLTLRSFGVVRAKPGTTELAAS